MILEEDDFILFAKLHWNLLNFVLLEADSFFDPSVEIDAFDLALEDKLDLFDVFYDNHVEYIDAYLSKNPDNLEADEREIVESWKSLHSGEFVLFRQLKKHAVVLGTGDDESGYAVIGLTEPMGNLVRNDLPATVKTALFPFKGIVVFDGLMRRLPHRYTGHGKKMLTKQYNAAKASKGLIAQLSPLGIPKNPPSAADRLQRLVEKLQTSLNAVRESRRKIKDFEDNIEPPFRQWLTKKHGDLEKRMKTLARETELLEELLYQAKEAWHFRHFKSPDQALNAVEKQLREEEAMIHEAEQRSKDPDFKKDKSKADSGNPFSGSPMDGIPDFIVDSMLDEFLRDMRGIDPSRMSAKDREKARQEFLGTFDHVGTGDKDAFEKSLLKIGADDSAKNKSKVNKAFRRLARLVHPDRNDDFDDEAKEIWEELQLRRDALDLESLEMLEMKWRLISNDQFKAGDEKRLKLLREELRDEELDLGEEMGQHSGHPMWGEKASKTPPRPVQQRAKRDLEGCIAELVEDKADLEREIAAFRKKASPKKKRTNTRKKAAKKKTPKKKAAKKKAVKKNALEQALKKKVASQKQAKPKPSMGTQDTFDFD